MENNLAATTADLDPNCEEHCGCGVPFAEHCPSCAEYLGAEYHKPDEEPLRRERVGNATYFYDADLHVGTVREQYRGRFLWVTRFVAGVRDTFGKAEDAMREELVR
jgi:hypothetical protein